MKFIFWIYFNLELNLNLKQSPWMTYAKRWIWDYNLFGCLSSQQLVDIINTNSLLGKLLRLDLWDDRFWKVTWETIFLPLAIALKFIKTLFISCTLPSKTSEVIILRWGLGCDCTDNILFGIYVQYFCAILQYRNKRIAICIVMSQWVFHNLPHSVNAHGNTATNVFYSLLAVHYGHLWGVFK